MEKKSNHQVKCVIVDAIKPHTNADNLELIHIGGYQVVVRKGQFNLFQKAVYIQPDSVVPQTEPFKFIWENYVTVDGTVPERRRRITVKKLRKEWSEGLLLPLSDFPGLNAAEGDDVSELIGVTHYNPDKGKESTVGANTHAPGYSKYPRSFKGWIYFLLHKIGLRKSTYGLDREQVKFTVPVYDVDALKNNINAFVPGELVLVSEKIHGSNARFIFTDGKMYAGSRTLWKSEKSKCVWRKALEQNPWIEEWCRAHPDFVLYGEVTPTQGEYYTYGCTNSQVKFFVFDIRYPDGTWASAEEFLWYTTEDDSEGSYLHIVPFVTSNGTRYDGSTPYIKYDLDVIKKIAEGPSLVPDANHVREGVVVRPIKERHQIGLGRVLLKYVSNAFLDKDKAA